VVVTSRLPRFLTAAAVSVGALLAASPAFAHPAATTHATDASHAGEGVLVVEGRHPHGPSDIHYVVSLTWSGDGHVADHGSVTATVFDEAGTGTNFRLPFDRASGRFMGMVHFPAPGGYSVRFTATNPDAVLDSYETVPPAAGEVHIPENGMAPATPAAPADPFPTPFDLFKAALQPATASPTPAAPSWLRDGTVKAGKKWVWDPFPSHIHIGNGQPVPIEITPPKPPVTN
jgi:hypothetical protein